MRQNKLAVYLKQTRADLGLTIREVSKRTKGKLSNPHYNRIENGLVGVPSPHTLYFLAPALKVEYMHLMELAGYIIVTNKRRAVVANKKAVTRNARRGI